MTGPIPIFPTPADAVVIVRGAVFRGNGFLLDGEARQIVLGQLSSGFEMLAAENRTGEFEQLVTTYVNRLVNELPRERIEYRDDRITNVAPGGVLPPAALSDALRRICPLWPFC